MNNEWDSPSELLFDLYKEQQHCHKSGPSQPFMQVGGTASHWEVAVSTSIFIVNFLRY